MFNERLLMAAAARRSRNKNSTIGVPGELGFGVGAFPGPASKLAAMGLHEAEEGFNDPTSEHYCEYVHTNGSVMVFIPAFAIRIGNAAAPLYSKYGADTIEIGETKLAGKDGWAIPRGFYDGGEEHPGFFIDKYLNSKDATKKQAISVKNGDPIALSTSYNKSSELPNCVGQILDAIELSRARGEHYSLVSCYQWAVISLITQAHAQAAASTEACAWYDASGQKNYPKGNNNYGSDIDDNTITFTAAGSGSYTYVRKTGSAAPLAKTTHNGQVSGICDVNGNMWQPVLGWQNPTSGLFKTAKLSMKMHDFTKNNRNDNSLFDGYTVTGIANGNWNYWKSPALYATDDTKFPLCGVIPKTPTTSNTGTEGFGEDGFYAYAASDRVLLVAGYCSSGAYAGSWCRYGDSYWDYDYYYASFRAAAYASL